MTRWTKKGEGYYEDEAGTLYLERINRTDCGNPIPAVWFLCEKATKTTLSGPLSLSQAKAEGVIYAATHPV